MAFLLINFNDVYATLPCCPFKENVIKTIQFSVKNLKLNLDKKYNNIYKNKEKRDCVINERKCINWRHAG